MKQLYKGEQLQFVYHLLVTRKEDDYAIDHATETAIHELISSGNREELWDLFKNTDDAREQDFAYTSNMNLSFTAHASLP